MSGFTNIDVFGVATGGNPLPITVGSGSNRMVIALAGHNRSDGHFEQMFINGVPGRIAADRLLVINKVQVAYWLDADLPTAGSYDITIDGAGSNRIFSALYVEGARQELIDSDGQDERTDNQNIFTLDCDGDTALLVMVQAAPDSGAESSATELYNQDRFAAWYQVGQGQTIQASIIGGQSSALNIAVAAAFEPLDGGTGTDVLPSTAHSVSLSRSPRVATGARIDATIAQSSSQAFAPVAAAGASVTPSAGRSASQGLNPSVELGAVVRPTLARSASEARTPSVFTVVTVRPTVARSLSRAINPSLGSDAFVRKHTLNAAVLNPKPQLYGLLQRRHTL